MMKTKQLINKRIKITKTFKITHLSCGRNHYNAKETGKTVRNKRLHKTLSKPYRQTINRSI